jgi:hypothetical protein
MRTQNMLKKKVKVVSAKDKKLWYNAHIGEILDVEWSTIDPLLGLVHWSRDEDQYACINIIYDCDVVVVNE